MKGDVFIIGDALTPARFWPLALRTEYKHARFYDELGYTYSEKHTKEYRALSKEDQQKIRFTFVNGVKVN